MRFGCNFARRKRSLAVVWFCAAVECVAVMIPNSGMAKRRKSAMVRQSGRFGRRVRLAPSVVATLDAID